MTAITEWPATDLSLSPDEAASAAEEAARQALAEASERRGYLAQRPGEDEAFQRACQDADNAGWELAGGAR